MNTEMKSLYRATRALLAAYLIAGVFVVLQPSHADLYTSGRTMLVSHYPDGTPADGGHPSISADGRYVAFESRDQLVPEDTDNLSDIYRKDLLTGQVIKIPGEAPGSAKGHAFYPSLSGDGSKVAFITGPWANSLRQLDNYGFGTHSVFHDISTGLSRRLNRQDWIGDTAKLSGDGRWAVTTNTPDEAETVVLEFVNTETGDWHQAAVLCEGCRFADHAAISRTGRFVVYKPGSHLNGTALRFMDRDADGDGIFDEPGTTNEITLVRGRYPQIAADGSRVMFTDPWGAPLGPSALGGWVSVWERATNRVSTVSYGSANRPAFSVGVRASISGDGRSVAYGTNEQVSPHDFNLGFDVYLTELETTLAGIASHTTHLVTPSHPDGQHEADVHGLEGNRLPRADRLEPSLSHDGRYAAYQSGDLYGYGEKRVWVRDRLASSCEMICMPGMASLRPTESEPGVPAGPLGRYVGSVLVDSSTSYGNYPMTALADGATYRLEATGIYRYEGLAGVSDARCRAGDPTRAFEPGNFADHGLLVDSLMPTWRPIENRSDTLPGTCSPSHTYETTYIGKGRGVNLKMQDWNYSDNTGYLFVSIFRI